MDVALCLIDKEKGVIEFAGARNPLIIVRDGDMEIIKGDKRSVGGVQPEKERTFTKYEIEIDPKATYYIFSDGYQDQFGGESGQKYLTKNFRKLLLMLHDQPLDEQKHALMKELDTWRGNYPQIDDILVMGIRLG